jgi:hypothetical protein
LGGATARIIVGRQRARASKRQTPRLKTGASLSTQSLVCGSREDDAPESDTGTHLGTKADKELAFPVFGWFHRGRPSVVDATLPNDHRDDIPPPQRLATVTDAFDRRTKRR